MATSHLPTRVLTLGLAMLAGVAVLLGCRGVSPLPGAQAPAIAFHQAGGTGLADIRVLLPEHKLPDLSAGARRVQYVDWTVAASARIAYMGSGIDGWVNVATAGFAVVGAQRVASFAGIALPSGKRRIVKVDLFDGPGATGVKLHTLWGVADIVAGSTISMVVTEYSTPTAEIFRDLIATGDKEKAMAVDASQVQNLVDNLLDYDSQVQVASSATGFDGNLDGATAPVKPALLDTHPATMAIMRGTLDASGVLVPYTVPSPPFGADLAPTPVRQATVTVKAIENDGSPLALRSVVIVSDPASEVQVTDGVAPVNQTFHPVAVGDWQASVVDTTSGRRISAPIFPTIWDGQSRSITLSMPYSQFTHILGTWDNQAQYPYGFNGESVHNSFAYLKSPAHLAVKAFGGANYLYLADVGNERIRYMKLDDTDASLDTAVGGGGALGTIDLSADSDLGFYQDPVSSKTYLIFSEIAAGGTYRIARMELNASGGPVGGTLSTLVDVGTSTVSNLTGWTIGHKPGSFTYDAPTQTLYLGASNGDSLVAIGMSAWPVVTSQRVITNAAHPPFGAGGVAKQGNYLFYSGLKSLATDTGAVNVYPLIRRDLTKDDAAASDAVAILASDPANYSDEPIYDFGDTITNRHTVEGVRFFQKTPHHHLSVDVKGNLYFFTRDPGLVDGAGNPTHPYGFPQLHRLSNAGAGDPSNNAWLMTHMAVTSSHAWTRGGFAQADVWGLTGIAVDPSLRPNGLNDLYCAGGDRVMNPNGVGSVPAHSVYRLRL